MAGLFLALSLGLFASCLQGTPDTCVHVINCVLRVDTCVVHECTQKCKGKERGCMYMCACVPIICVYRTKSISPPPKYCFLVGG